MGAAAWLVFALAWWRVFDLHAQVGGALLVALVTCAAVIFAVNVWWVAHNRRIHQRKGARRGRPVQGYDYTCDGIGRRVRLLPAVGRPSIVELAVTGAGLKVYRAVRP